MGELSLRWPSRHGFPRSHRGKSHHPQGSRQVLSCTRPQRRRTAGIKDQESFPSIDSNAQLLTCIPQSVTTTPAHTQPPKWTTFSPPPTFRPARNHWHAAIKDSLGLVHGLVTFSRGDYIRQVLIRAVHGQVVVETYGAGDGNRHPTPETWENTSQGP